MVEALQSRTLLAIITGTDAFGTQTFPPDASAIGLFYGIQIGSSDNTIGGTAAADRNLIAGNDYDIADDQGVDDNLIEGNLIGTDITSTQPLGNAQWLRRRRLRP